METQPRYPNAPPSGVAERPTLLPPLVLCAAVLWLPLPAHIISTKGLHGRMLALARASSRSALRLRLTVPSVRAYHENIIDHYESPRNVGSMDKKDPNVGTGLVGAPACGDVMKLQMRVGPDGVVEEAVFKVRRCIAAIIKLCCAPWRESCKARAQPCNEYNHCVHVTRPEWHPPTLLLHSPLTRLLPCTTAQTFGCGSAIASSSYATEWLKGKTLEEAGSIKNSDIAKHLKLPPVKLHCSMLAEDAIKLAVKDFQEKQAKFAPPDADKPAAAQGGH